MYDIYIKNYCLRNGTYVTDETLMYSIPMAPNDDNALTDPKVTVEMGKAGSFEFTMNLWHPYYESLRQMKTIFRIVYDGDTIFRGRVLTIDTGHMTGVKKVHCEGDMAFLLDSQAEGIPDTTRPKTNALTYIQTLLSNHNSQMANDMADKQFALGQVPGTYTSSITEPQQLHPDNNYRYGSSSWKDSQSAFTELSDSFGGFWRTRYQNGTTYLDWLDNYYDTTINPQIVEIGENILDISSSSEVNNIFTALIPVGSKNGKNLYINGYQTAIHGNNNYILVPQILQVFSDAELNSGFHSKHDYASAVNDYGMIFRTESFSNADTQEKLWQYATDWIKNNYCGGLAQFSVGAMDMHHVGESIGKYLLGGRVTVVYPDVDHRDTNPEAVIQKVMTVMKIVYNLNNPEKNQYTIGIPNAILKKNYGEKSSKKGGGGKAASDNKKQEQTDEHFKNWKEYTEEVIWRRVQDTVTNSEAFAKYVEKYGDQAGADVTYSSYVVVGDIANKVPGYSSQYNFGQMILNGHTGEIEINGPINQQEIRKAQETGELTKSIIIGGLNKVGITINQALPYAALNWNKAQLEQFNNLSVAKLEADGTGSKLTFSTIKEQSPTNVGQKWKSMLLDSANGHLTGMELDLAGSLEEFEDVADKEMLGKIGLNGPEANLFTSADGETKNTEIDGHDDGVMRIGKDDNDNWLVIANDKVTYQDQSGTTHTLEPGFVTANDIRFAGEHPIPSFKTQVAIIGTAIAENIVVTGQLQASMADIEKLVSDTITANTRLAAARITAGSLTVTGNANINGTLTASSLSIRDQSGTTYDAVTTAVVDFGTPTASEGQITIPYTHTTGRGTTQKSINFNIADTAFYKAGIGIKSVGAWVWDGENKVFTSTITPNDGRAETVTTPHVSTVVNRIEYKENLHAYDISVSSVSNGQEMSSISTWSDTDAYTSGIAAGEANFEHATVTPQGEQVVVTPVKTTSAIRIDSTPVTLHNPGTTTVQGVDASSAVTAYPAVSSGGTTYYKAASAQYVYPGNGGSYTVQGDEVVVTPIRTTTVIRLGSEVTISGQRYRPIVTSGGTLYYQKGDQVTYHRAGTTTVTARGSRYSITPIDTTASVQLGASGSYYAGTGNTYTVQGTTQEAYKQLSSGGTIYYQANPQATYRAEGTPDTTTYYTKKS